MVFITLGGSGLLDQIYDEIQQFAISKAKDSVASSRLKQQNRRAALLFGTPK